MNLEPGYKRKVFHIKIKWTHNHNTRDRWGCGGWLVEGKVLGWWAYKLSTKINIKLTKFKVQAKPMNKNIT